MNAFKKARRSVGGGQKSCMKEKRRRARAERRAVKHWLQGDTTAPTPVLRLQDRNVW